MEKDNVLKKKCKPHFERREPMHGKEREIHKSHIIQGRPIHDNRCDEERKEKDDDGGES